MTHLGEPPRYEVIHSATFDLRILREDGQLGLLGTRWTGDAWLVWPLGKGDPTPYDADLNIEDYLVACAIAHEVGAFDD